jgi:hypothetical protein
MNKGDKLTIISQAHGMPERKDAKQDYNEKKHMHVG